jgi:asparagine synthase (glutamine-hydrolysing)
MREINDWREVVKLPILVKPRWTLDELEMILTQAISDCIFEYFGRGYGEIYTTLSGGLDSSFCLAKTREITGSERTIRTYTIGGYHGHPDIEFAGTAASYFGTFHNTIVPSAPEIKIAENELYSLWKDESRDLGNVAVYMLYRHMAESGVKCVIAHDGIDELLGGYWGHRESTESDLKEPAFEFYWERLSPDHLFPLVRKASHFGIKVIFPYLQKEVVEYISKIPIDERTSREESKIPLRRIAEKYLPVDIIKRKKFGFCSALDKD